MVLGTYRTYLRRVLFYFLREFGSFIPHVDGIEVLCKRVDPDLERWGKKQLDPDSIRDVGMYGTGYLDPAKFRMLVRGTST